MSSGKVFTIIAGINGAGKTSLYHVLRDSENLGMRINIDELAKEIGDWRDELVQFKAMKSAISMMNESITEGKSFHLETTLPGRSLIRQILRAKEAGFTVVMYFVGVDDVRVAINRVHQRMANGGHGIPDSMILKRFSQLNDNLRKILPLCDGAFLFDNTSKFKQIAILENKRLIDCDRDLPFWFIDLIDELPD